MPKEKTPFYKKRIFIISAFILFPPIGIPLFFKFMSRPSKNVKIALSAVYGLLWLIVVIANQIGQYRTYEINGESVRIDCDAYCSYIEEYGSDDTLRTLASIGITEVSSTDRSLKDNKALMRVASTADGADKLVLEYKDGKLDRIYNEKYPSITYYSATNDNVIEYPGSEEIAAIKDAERKEAEAKKKAEEEAKAQAEKEEAEQKAAEARVPSAGDTVVLCDQAFLQQYPYEGSKVHSVLGVITNEPYGADTRLFKADVTIANAFGAKYGAVMECVTKKTGDRISIESFNVY